MNYVESPERCFSCNGIFTDYDQVALISTEVGWVCELPGDLAKLSASAPGDVAAFHKRCWERLGVSTVVRC
jgi:hypothetical protein